MLVGLESMEELTSRTRMLSRKPLGLQLILWTQPIASIISKILKKVKVFETEGRMETVEVKFTVNTSAEELFAQKSLLGNYPVVTTEAEDVCTTGSDM